MGKKRIDKLVRIFFGVAGLMVLVGIFFRIQEYPYGRLMTIGGTFIIIYNSGDKTIFFIESMITPELIRIKY